MLVLTRCMKIVQLSLYSLLEQRTLQPWDIPSRHSSLVNSVKNTGDGGKIVGLEDLRVFEESEGVAGEEADSSTNGDCAKLRNTLW